MHRRQDTYDKINAFRSSVPSVSQSALGAIITKAKNGLLPSVGSRPTIRAARDSVATQSTPHGDLSTTIDLPNAAETGTVSVDVSLPAPALYVAAQCCYMSQLLRITFAVHPCTPLRPWSMILYSDEVVPGNVLRQENLKKLLACYWSILEFGSHALCKEAFWFVGAVITSKSVASISGGVSALLGDILVRTYCGPLSLSRVGIRVRLDDGSELRLFLSLRIVLSDEAALHSTWLCKGAAGTKPCVCCMNVYNRRWKAFEDSDGSHDVKPFSVIHHERDCVLHTQETINALQEKLQHYKATLSKKDFDEKSSLNGFGYHPRGLLADPRLATIVNVPDQNMFDWAHCTLQGILGLVIYQVFVSVSPAERRPVAFRRFHEYAQRWVWPRRLESKIDGCRNVFTKKRISSHLEADTVKLTMSEGLSIVPIFRHWVLFEILPSRPDLQAVCNCALLLMLFIQIVNISVRFAVDPDFVADVYEQFFSAYVTLFGEDKTVPKFHYLVHIASYIRRFGFALNCIVTERKHKLLKQFADHHDNPRQLARSVLRESLNHHIAELGRGSHLNLEPHLLGRIFQAPADLRDWLSTELAIATTFTCSHEARVNKFQTCAVGDIAVIVKQSEWYVCCLWYLVDAADGVFFAVVDRYECIDSASDWSRWKVRSNPALEHFDNIFDVLIYEKLTGDDGSLLVIHPYALRQVV